MFPLRVPIVFALYLIAASAFAQLTPEQTAANLKSFEIVWQTVRDHHPDPNLNGLDWKAIHDRIAPLIANARTMDEARDLLRSMLAPLNASHYSIIPGDAYSRPADSPSTEAAPGFETALIGGKAVISKVEPDSPAARAGLKPGMIVAGVNGANVDSILDGFHAANTPEGKVKAERSIARHLAGPADTAVGLDVVDPNGRTERIEIPRVKQPGETVRFSNLPAMRVVFESRLLGSRVGYIRLNVFLDPAKVMPEFEDAVKRFDSAPGIVLDLRGNPGGIGIMAMGMAGFFVDESGLKLGEMKTREMTMKFAVFPRPHTYRGKLAILVDEGSASTSEILAQGLQDFGRARIFGARTAGAALPSDIIRLPNGDGFQYPQASYVSARGRVLEANGVIPDVEVHQTAGDLAAGKDPVLEAAVRWITSK